MKLNMHRKGWTILAAAMMTVGLTAGTAGLAGATAPAKAINVSFSSTGTGSSAGWTAGKAGKAAGSITLTVGNGIISTEGAIVTLNNVPSTLPTTEPTFTTDNYNAGSPRWYIQLSSGSYLTGYPPISGLNGSYFSWSVWSCSSLPGGSDTYTSYALAMAATMNNAGCGGTVTSVNVVADGDQNNTTDTITLVQYNSSSLKS